MEFHPFPARLRAAYNGVQEYGSARVAGADDAVDFTGDFVPLLPLGAEAAVEWIYGQKVVAAYAGTVYLSTAGLVRVVGIDPALIAPTRDIFALNTDLPGTISPAGAAPPSRGAKAGPAARPGALPVRVRYLSTSAIRLNVPQPVGEGQRLLLDVEVDFLTLRGLELVVRQQVPLRRGDIILVCQVPPAGDENFIALSAYSARLEKLPAERP